MAFFSSCGCQQSPNETSDKAAAQQREFWAEDRKAKELERSSDLVVRMSGIGTNLILQILRHRLDAEYPKERLTLQRFSGILREMPATNGFAIVVLPAAGFAARVVTNISPILESNGFTRIAIIAEGWGQHFITPNGIQTPRPANAD